jgi:Zn-dependent M28 family amino/carboxypeptidase
MSHIKALAEDVGPRKSGTTAEDQALVYAKTYLQDLGYQVDTIPVTLPGGRSSRDLRAVKQGRSNSVVMVGGHIDSKAGAPGGNDNASGVAVTLELARDLRDADLQATVEFVIFGAEEMTDSNPDHHHYGSRQFVEALTSAQRSALVAMISVDMVGYGEEFTVRTMNRGPQLLRNMVKAYSDANGLPARYTKDTSRYGWSDHEPFELAGYPAVWLEWREDPAYHTARDTYAHCRPLVIQSTGDMLLSFLAQLSEADLESLAAARRL